MLGEQRGPTAIFSPLAAPLYPRAPIRAHLIHVVPLTRAHQISRSADAPDGCHRQNENASALARVRFYRIKNFYWRDNLYWTEGILNWKENLQ